MDPCFHATELINYVQSIPVPLMVHQNDHRSPSAHHWPHHAIVCSYLLFGERLWFGMTSKVRCFTVNQRSLYHKYAINGVVTSKTSMQAFSENQCISQADIGFAVREVGKWIEYNRYPKWRTFLLFLAKIVRHFGNQQLQSILRHPVFPLSKMCSFSLASMMVLK